MCASELTGGAPLRKRPGGNWILGAGRVGYRPDDRRASYSEQEHRDDAEMCGWMCDEVELRSCPRLGVPCEARWDRYEEPRYEVRSTWTFVEQCISLLGVVPKSKLVLDREE